MPHLGGGGAERVMAQLARSLPRDCFEVHLGLITEKGCLSEALQPGVCVHGIGARRVLFGAPGIVRMVRELRPDLVLSGMFHLNFLVLLLRPFFPARTRILVRQNGMPRGFEGQRFSAVLKSLYQTTYPHADGIICQTDAMAKEMTGLVGSRAGIRVLRNPVDVQGIRRAVQRNSQRWVGGGPRLLSVGRLSPEKGFDILLEAFAEVRTQFPSAQLVILGQGVEENALRSKCQLLKLIGCVRFMGYVADPESWFGEASLLVIPSRLEAFPNILLEGAAAGLPIVTTPCSAGVTDLLYGQPWVWVAPEISSPSLACSIKAALCTVRSGDRFPHLWLDPFDLPDSVSAYECLIRETLAGVAR
jgi:glycosyltransferase involved in cell wall biosynthesis